MDGRENEQPLRLSREELDTSEVQSLLRLVREPAPSSCAPDPRRGFNLDAGIKRVKRSRRQPSRAEAFPRAAGEPTEGWGSGRSRFQTAQVAANVKAATKSAVLGTDKARCAGGHRQLELKLNSYRFFWRGEGRSPEIKTAEVVRLKISPSDSLWHV